MPACNFTIYVIKNVENGKVYVGSSTEYEKRKQTHLRELEAGTHHAEHLQRAWEVYGADSFIFRVLCQEQGTESDRWERERGFIVALKAHDPRFGYNACSNAGGMRGFKMPEAAKAKISAAMLGRPKTEEHRRKLSLANGEPETFQAFGRSQRLWDWAQEFGMHVETFKMRLKRGANLETALTTPLRRRAV